MGFTLKHTSVLSNNKGRETQPQVVWRDFCGSRAPGFPPCLKAYQKTPGVQARGMVSLQGPKYATAIQGGLNLPLALMKEVRAIQCLRRTNRSAVICPCKGVPRLLLQLSLVGELP